MYFKHEDIVKEIKNKDDVIIVCDRAEMLPVSFKPMAYNPEEGIKFQEITERKIIYRVRIYDVDDDFEIIQRGFSMSEEGFEHFKVRMINMFGLTNKDFKAIKIKKESYALRADTNCGGAIMKLDDINKVSFEMLYHESIMSAVQASLSIEEIMNML